MVYMVTYDLCSPGQNYNKVIEAIQKASSGNVWCKVCESSYLIKSNLTSQQVFNKIDPYLDKNDTLLVIEVIQNYYGQLDKDVIPYMKSPLFA